MLKELTPVREKTVNQTNNQGGKMVKAICTYKMHSLNGKFKLVERVHFRFETLKELGTLKLKRASHTYDFCNAFFLDKN